MSVEKFQVSSFRFQKAAIAFYLVLFIAVQVFAGEKVDSLVQSELAFAQTSSEKGIKTAFLAYLADDSVLFRPGAVPGKKWTAEHPDTPGVLIWEPSYAEISGAGDLGFTTGPYTFKESKEAKETYYGQFFSIWKKQSDQSWKVLLDAGLQKQKHKTPLKTQTGKSSIVSKEELEKQRKVVEKADLGLFATTDAILLHGQDYETDCTFVQNGSGISQSADLAYFYGTFQCGAARGNYVRVWRKVDQWQVAVDYMAR